MRLGIAVFLRPAQIGGAPPLARIAEFCALVEEKGFSGFWLPDSIGRGYPTLEPLSVLSALAAFPGTIELGTGVLQVPLRQPRELAHRIQTVSALAPGRLRLGVGAGSTEIDFKVLGADYAARFKTLPSSLEIMGKIWRGELKDGSTQQVWPGTEGGPPVYLGAWRSPRWITHAARLCDGWIASGLFSSWSDLETGIRIFREAGGKRAILANVPLDVLSKHPGDGHPEKGISLACSPEEAGKRLRRIEQLGFDDVVMICPLDQPAQLDALNQVRA